MASFLSFAPVKKMVLLTAYFYFKFLQEHQGHGADFKERI
jgi:hypothetical protein